MQRWALRYIFMLIWFYPVEALLLSRLTKFVLSFYIYSPLPHNVVGYGYQYHSAMSTASKYFKWASLTLCSFQNVYSNSRNGATPFFNRWHIDLTGGLRGLLKGVAILWKNEGVAPLRELLYNSYLNLCFNYWNELKCSPVLVVPQVLQATEFIGTSLCFSFCVSSEK